MRLPIQDLNVPIFDRHKKRNYLDHVVRAITHRGNRLTTAWMMARGSYAYTASFIGRTDPSMGEPVFTHWDALKGGVEIFWDYLWRQR